MKILFHMGLFKTGTTSLQTALHAARGELGAHGVLYPDGGPGRENHRFLVPLFTPPERVERGVREAFAGDPARVRRGAAELWTAIRREAERTRPKLLILSTEHIFAAALAENFADLAQQLSELSQDIEIVLYFREPAAHFASTVQQSVKTGQPVFVLRPSKLQASAAMLEAAFGRPLTACVGDRDQLIGGDIVADFVARFVTPVVGAVTVPQVRLNESISAEMSAILDRFRRQRYPGHPTRMPDYFSLRSILDRVEAQGPRPPRARLRREAAEAIRRGALDALWLRERYGLVFAGLDYARIDGAPPADLADRPIDELFEVDPDRRARLEAAAQAEALAAWRQVERISSRLRAAARTGRSLFARRRSA